MLTGVLRPLNEVVDELRVRAAGGLGDGGLQACGMSFGRRRDERCCRRCACEQSQHHCCKAQWVSYATDRRQRCYSAPNAGATDNRPRMIPHELWTSSAAIAGNPTLDPGCFSSALRAASATRRRRAREIRWVTLDPRSIDLLLHLHARRRAGHVRDEREDRLDLPHLVSWFV